MQIIHMRGGFEVLIDDEDAPLVVASAWQIKRSGTTLQYARRTAANGKTVFMHRAIMEPPSDMVIDHIDGNGLNNQRSNLRIVTHGQNLWNRRDKPEGVTWSGRTDKWRATIGYQSKKYEVGFYPDREMAVAARAYVASIIRRGIAPDAAEVDRLELRPTIRRLIFSV